MLIVCRIQNLDIPQSGILIRFRTRRPPISTSKLTKTTVLDIFAETQTRSFGLDPRPPAYLLFFWGPSEAPNSVCQIQDRGRSRTEADPEASARLRAPPPQRPSLLQPLAWARNPSVQYASLQSLSAGGGYAVCASTRQVATH